MYKLLLVEWWYGMEGRQQLAPAWWEDNYMGKGNQGARIYIWSPASTTRIYMGRVLHYYLFTKCSDMTFPLANYLFCRCYFH